MKTLGDTGGRPSTWGICGNCSNRPSPCRCCANCATGMPWMVGTLNCCARHCRNSNTSAEGE
eukprot:14141959-Alexandrium_andersonii.AAC.1